MQVTKQPECSSFFFKLATQGRDESTQNSSACKPLHIFSHDLWEKVVLYTYVCNHPYFDFLLFAVLYPYTMYLFLLLVYSY